MFSDSSKLLGVAVCLGDNFFIITLIFMKCYVLIDNVELCVFDFSII
jgi:hypothetical protein